MVSYQVFGKNLSAFTYSSRDGDGDDEAEKDDESGIFLKHTTSMVIENEVKKLIKKSAEMYLRFNEFIQELLEANKEERANILLKQTISRVKS